MSNEMVSGWRVATYTGGQGNCVEVGTICRRGRSARHEGRRWVQCCTSIRPCGTRSRSISRDSPFS